MKKTLFLPIIGGFIILVIAIGAVFYFKSNPKQADVAVLQEKTKNLEEEVAELNKKVEMMQNMQTEDTISTTPSTTITDTPNTPPNDTTSTDNEDTNEATTAEPQNTNAAELPAEEEYINEMESDVEEMLYLYEETMELVNLVYEDYDELLSLVEDAADIYDAVEDDFDDILVLAEEVIGGVDQAIKVAEAITPEYKKALDSTQALVLSRKELYEANISGNQSAILAANAKFLKTIGNESTNLSNLDGKLQNTAFISSYLADPPSYIQDLKGFSELSETVVKQFSLQGFSGMNTNTIKDAIPAIDTSKLNIDTSSIKSLKKR